MKLIDFSRIKNDIKSKLRKSDNNDNLSERIEEFEDLMHNGDSIAFTIRGIRERGFIVNTYGLNGYISFMHMPWQYKSIHSWEAVFKSLKGKVLFGIVHHYQRNPLKIVLDAKIPQFKKYNLIENNIYSGIVIQKLKSGFFVDIGHSFRWKSGSIVEFLHKRNFETEEVSQIQLGDIIEPSYWGLDDESRPILGVKESLKEWLTSDIEKLKTEILPVKVTVSPDYRIKYLVSDKYEGILSLKKSLKKLNITKGFENGDIIHCEVIGFNYHNKTLVLLWDFEHEISEVMSRIPNNSNLGRSKRNMNSVENYIDENTARKLSLLEKSNDTN